MNKYLISVRDLDNMKTDPNLVILDASRPQNMEERIPNARPFDLEAVFRDYLNELPNTVPSASAFEEGCRALGIHNHSDIVIYDDKGIYTSPRAWWLFRLMGHEQVRVLDGGLPEWKRHGMRVEVPAHVIYDLGTFKAHFKPTLLTTYSDVKKNVNNAEFILVDARSAGRFEGRETEPRKELQSGSIPGSVNVPYKKVLNDNGTMKSTSDLKTVFMERSGQDGDLVFTCGSGITACIIMLAAEGILNNNKAVFDGSWTEWAVREGLTIK